MLPDALCDIARCLHGERAQAFRPDGTPNVKLVGQHHMCSHKLRVVYGLGTVYLTLSRQSLHRGRRMPYVFVQGSARPVVGVARLFDPLSAFQCVYVMRYGWHEPHPRGRGTLSKCWSAFGVSACVLWFFAKF